MEGSNYWDTLDDYDCMYVRTNLLNVCPDAIFASIY